MVDGVTWVGVLLADESQGEMRESELDGEVLGEDAASEDEREDETKG